MELILQIVTDPAYSISKQMLRVFNESGGGIGRALDSYWVIPDPKSYVSATHCVIEHDGAGFWLRDLSRNGVVFNGSRQPIDPKKPVLIRNGDRIQIGLYVVVAHIRDRDPSRINQVAPPAVTASLDFAVERSRASPSVEAHEFVPSESGPSDDSSGDETTGEHRVSPGESSEPDPLGSTTLETTGEHPAAEAGPVAQSVAPPQPDEVLAATTALDESIAGDAARRFIALDAAALRESGLLPPEREERLIANQFRHIKRRVIPGAFGKGEQAFPGGRLLMLTSSLPGEGKTFCAMNLALSLAREKDLDVLLVDADVAKPKLSRLLGVPEAPGLLNLLADDQLDIPSLILRTDRDSLSFLPAGRTQEDEAPELLASARMTEISSRLLRSDPRRIVVFDAPPLLLTNEARVLAGAVGQVLLVVAAGVTPRPAVDESIQYIGEDKFVGLILNQSKANRPGSYYGYGDYGYGGYG